MAQARRTHACMSLSLHLQLGVHTALCAVIARAFGVKAAVEMFDRLNTLGRVAAKVQEEILSAWHFPEERSVAVGAMGGRGVSQASGTERAL